MVLIAAVQFRSVAPCEKTRERGLFALVFLNFSSTLGLIGSAGGLLGIKKRLVGVVFIS